MRSPEMALSMQLIDNQSAPLLIVFVFFGFFCKTKACAKSFGEER